MEQKRIKLFSSFPIRRKLFTSENVTRRKLFSTTKRRKLFSEDGDESLLKTVTCMDCGYSMQTLASTTNLICPKCGGKRFNVESNSSTLEESDISDQKEFSKPSDNFEKKLKMYSGITVPEDNINKLFSDTGYNANDLIEKGFAKVTEDNNIKIYDTAYLQSKLFSKLIVSVTKVLDLDPIDRPKEEIISEMCKRSDIEPKNVILIKKAHSIPIMKETGFSDTLEWIKDSGIKNDLHLEFGGSQLDLDKFKNILSERYDDAPEDIIDSLINNNIIKVFGDKVEIL